MNNCEDSKYSISNPRQSSLSAAEGVAYFVLPLFLNFQEEPGSLMEEFGRIQTLYNGARL